MKSIRETIHKETQTLELLDKHLKSFILSMFKELKGDISKELKENKRIISYQMKNTHKDIEII